MKKYLLFSFSSLIKKYEISVHFSAFHSKWSANNVICSTIFSIKSEKLKEAAFSIRLLDSKIAKLQKLLSVWALSHLPRSWC